MRFKCCNIYEVFLVWRLKKGNSLLFVFLQSHGGEATEVLSQACHFRFGDRCWNWVSSKESWRFAWVHAHCENHHRQSSPWLAQHWDKWKSPCRRVHSVGHQTDQLCIEWTHSLDDSFWPEDDVTGSGGSPCRMASPGTSVFDKRTVVMVALFSKGQEHAWPALHTAIRLRGWTTAPWQRMRHWSVFAEQASAPDRCCGLVLVGGKQHSAWISNMVDQG